MGLGGCCNGKVEHSHHASGYRRHSFVFIHPKAAYDMNFVAASSTMITADYCSCTLTVLSASRWILARSLLGV